MSARDAGIPDHPALYEAYRSIFAGTPGHTAADAGLSIILLKGMAVWLQSPACCPVPEHTRPPVGVPPSSNELVMLLASMIGG